MGSCSEGSGTQTFGACYEVGPAPTRETPLKELCHHCQAYATRLRLSLTLQRALWIQALRS